MNQNVQNAPRYQLIKEEVELIIFKIHAITVILKSSESIYGHEILNSLANNYYVEKPQG